MLKVGGVSSPGNNHRAVDYIPPNGHPWKYIYEWHCSGGGKKLQNNLRQLPMAKVRTSTMPK